MNRDQTEIAKFAKLAAHWWDPQGALKTLHDINPLRLHYIDTTASLQNKKVLDIGCGGGILAESMAKRGAEVTGIDLSEEVLHVAKLHQQKSHTPVNYFLASAEEFALNHAQEFDIVTCLELLEHVPDPLSILKAATTLVKPGGQLFFSTLNRTIQSYLFAIVGAEYLLKILPKNTHDFAKFIRPSELAEWARQAALTVHDIVGITYNPLTKQYQLSKNISVNYLMYLKHS
ncbi:MAG: bifunctional 3-demethylubiquinol 3-O-methyltransferase/2-polyprenyl-6-hydroxyphenol methylase [Gammaproteobacteria bacterium]|jgi:2-polyprenyl-6-hydroxyphenyl methylase/3-demethylubiquinone-9 3-methyltransferase|nr:bifunctional 3-demethylubiquinol 3-O-methyltransferase/2-polyprenyl-6-hydroxyphenol methylase [Gammaproteobacteria bacterium]MCE3237592.1 bifunctional 3-demethylubiquinol 3-O-methyltransferase/2-polyprenyl-6-hydroxyphenol methylase [Gammaproteobacteria bacterium]